MSWGLHYREWMIGDGEPHRSVGEVFNWFAIEFWSERPLTRISAGTRSAIPCGDYKYRVAAEGFFNNDDDSKSAATIKQIAKSYG